MLSVITLNLIHFTNTFIIALLFLVRNDCLFLDVNVKHISNELFNQEQFQYDIIIEEDGEKILNKSINSENFCFLSLENKIFFLD